MLLARCIPVVITDSGGLELKGSQVQVPAVLQDARVSWRGGRRWCRVGETVSVCIWAERMNPNVFGSAVCRKTMGRNPVSLALVWLFLVISRMTIFYPDGTQMFTRAFNPYTKKLTRARARAHTHTKHKKTVSPW